ncbi:transporter [Methylococcus mesophilus]|uniref:transporter n=1 Tax=Methylococcus mesophilus TaxID=2993564 RepID=UPI00224B49FC|nr:transporter [Methylococcus mesophilus]UZR29324.1 transporter [Methylococcus mesophilus]
MPTSLAKELMRPYRNALALAALCALQACTTTTPGQPVPESGGSGHAPSRAARKNGDAEPDRHLDELIAAYGAARADAVLKSNSKAPQAADRAYDEALLAYGRERGAVLEDAFFKGRYNRSRARSPENLESWRSQPDIANPGADLANFPNSAFTLPEGRAYVEIAPFAYYGSAENQPAQYNTEFLLRYGLTDDIELRLFGNGVSWQGGAKPEWGFSPLAFDTKIQLWLEKQDYFLPAAGFEAYLQTPWLSSSSVFNQGTQPSFTFNFDQSLPFDIDLEYNFGATRTQNVNQDNVWELSIQWALQRDLFDRDFAVFVHGYHNNLSLPRGSTTAPGTLGGDSQNAVGAGFIWTLNNRISFWGQTSRGTTRITASIISFMGFAAAF